MSIPFAVSVDVSRYTDGDYSSGAWSDSGASTVSIVMHIQPDQASGGVTLQDSDGARWVAGKLQIYAEDQLYPSGVNGYKADRLTFDGATYEITSAAHYNTNTPIPHWSCIAELIDGNVG